MWFYNCSKIVRLLPQFSGHGSTSFQHCGHVRSYHARSFCYGRNSYFFSSNVTFFKSKFWSCIGCHNCRGSFKPNIFVLIFFQFFDQIRNCIFYFAMKKKSAAAEENRGHHERNCQKSSKMRAFQHCSPPLVALHSTPLNQYTINTHRHTSVKTFCANLLGVSIFE